MFPTNVNNIKTATKNAATTFAALVLKVKSSSIASTVELFIMSQAWIEDWNWKKNISTLKYFVNNNSNYKSVVNACPSYYQLITLPYYTGHSRPVNLASQVVGCHTYLTVCQNCSNFSSPKMVIIFLKTERLTDWKYDSFDDFQTMKHVVIYVLLTISSLKRLSGMVWSQSAVISYDTCRLLCWHTTFDIYSLK